MDQETKSEPKNVRVGDWSFLEISSFNSGDIESDVLTAEFFTLMEDGRSALTTQEGEVIDLYFGLTQQRAMGLSGIAEHYGTSVDEARRIKNRALGKLRTYAGQHELKAYLPDLEQDPR